MAIIGGVDVDADDVDPASGELAGHPPRAATGIEDGAGAERGHEVGLAVDVDTGGSQPVEALLVLLAGPPLAGPGTARPARRRRRSCASGGREQRELWHFDPGQRLVPREPGHGRVEVDLGLRRLGEAPVAPADLDMPVH